MATKKTDEKILQLIREVNKQKADIMSVENPRFLTDCSFRYDENNRNASINLHVESNIRNLVMIAAFVHEKEEWYKKTVALMEVDAPDFTWCGFTADSWVEDLKMRINKIQIASKKKKLEVLESRLNNIISPELRAELELQAIEEELK